jgi:hypothetical protein
MSCLRVLLPASFLIKDYYSSIFSLWHRIFEILLTAQGETRAGGWEETSLNRTALEAPNLRFST